MLGFFLLLLLAMPIVEIALLLQGAVVIGVLPVIILTVSTALLGGFLIKQQGLSVMRELQGDLAENRPPVAAVVDGASLLVAAPLLMTPGFITDGIGFLLLVPPVRYALARIALRRIQAAHERGNIVIIKR
ncbi:MAG: FxsA family protein [Pseudomonadota bacterium]